MMIETAHSKVAPLQYRERFDGFYVSKPNILEPRRPMAMSEIKLRDVKPRATRNIRLRDARPYLTTTTFFHEIVSVDIFPSIDC